MLLRTATTNTVRERNKTAPKRGGLGVIRWAIDGAESVNGPWVPKGGEQSLREIAEDFADVLTKQDVKARAEIVLSANRRPFAIVWWHRRQARWVSTFTTQ
jgi:hypothetical protein